MALFSKPQKETLANMPPLPLILFPFVILAFFPLFARSQGPIIPYSLPGAYQNSPEGLRWQLQDILSATRDHNRPKVESLIRQMEIPNYEEWFTKTFGREDGESWAGAYGRNLGENEKNFEDLLTQLAGEDGEFVTRNVNDDPAPARKIEAGLVDALRRPVVNFYVSWKKPGSPQDSKSSPVGYFVFLDGRFRWDSAISSIEIQPEPASNNTAPKDLSSAQTAGGPNNPPAGGKDNGIFRVGVGGVGHPTCDYCPNPGYTKLARKKHLEGVVVLQVIIQADGRVTDIKIVKSPNPELTEMAVEGVSRWRMNPARRADGELVPVIVPIEVAFSLLH